MSKLLLDLNIYESKTTGLPKTMIVEFLPREGDASTWESQIEDLARSGAKVVFRINYIDPSGLVFLLLMRHWLRYATPKIIHVETSVPGIRAILKLQLGELVTFVDHSD